MIDKKDFEEFKEIHDNEIKKYKVIWLKQVINLVLLWGSF